MGKSTAREASKPVGKTRDVGFQVGVRKTFPVALEEAWDYFFSNEGLALWLGSLESGRLERGEDYCTREGVEGRLRVWEPLSHVRLTWKKPGWSHFSTLQVRIMEAKSGTTVSFHQEKLLDSRQREEMKVHWKEVAEALSQVWKKEG